MSRASEWREWRLANNLSQNDLAIAIGLGLKGGGRKTVWNIENGNTQPSYLTQRKFENLKKKYARAKREE
jgi:transcriptional regulator with XRE-family HTH domain